MSLDSTETLKALSLFSGCGGIDLGLVQAGYEVVWANDKDEDSCETYRRNLGEHVVCGDIRTLDVPAIDDIDLLTAGFPCQPFSNAGSRRGKSDDRGNLFEETFRFIENLKPKAIIYENVRGLLSFRGSDPDVKLIDEISSHLRNLGYFSTFRLLNFAHFGVPQNRIRVVVVALKAPDYLPFAYPPALSGGTDMSIQSTLAGLTSKTPNQTELMKLNPQAIHFGSMIPEGGSWKDLPYEVLPDRWKKIRDNMARYHYPKFFRRYARHDVAGTVTAAFKPENAAVWHPTEDRIFSVREIARFQTFPDDFIFYGRTTKSKYQQIGNAVPPHFARLMGKQLVPYLTDMGIGSIDEYLPEHVQFNVNRPRHFVDGPVQDQLF
ncbi:MAG: DNA cytosine methyltransferase [bacterium]|nr:DNA cytosine methyltransferase [bacterium]